jgi:hypothetical protein
MTEEEDEPKGGAVVIPATKENLDKVMEFFASFSDEDKASDNTEPTDDTKADEE